MDASAFDTLVKQGVYKFLVDEYEAEPVVYPRICEMITGADIPIYGEIVSTMAGMGRPKFRADGAPIESDAYGEGYQAYHPVRLLSQKIELPERLVELMDAGGLQAEVRKRTRGWGQTFATEKDRFVAGMFQKGTLTAGSATYFDGTFAGGTDPYPKFVYDGLPFFDTAHTQKYGAGTFANHTAALALSTANLQTVVTAMAHTNAYDERNEPIVVAPTVLLVPPALKFTAATIINSTLVPGSSNNDINTLRGELEAISWRHLTDDTDAWWVGEAGKGVRVFDSGSPVIQTYWDPKTKMWGITAECRFGVCVTDWRRWYSANKAAA